MKLLSALTLMMMSAVASAQTNPAPVDPTLFPTTGYMRLQNGDFEILASQTRSFLKLDPITGRQILDPLTGKAEIDDAQAYVYDARTPFPKMVGGGANYAVLADGSLVTFSSTWEKPLPKGKMFFEVETYGGNYMVKRGTHEIVSVSSTGYVSAKAGGEFGTTVTAPAIRLVGGNYFIDVNNELWTINAKGYVFHSIGPKYPLATLAGGSFFYQQDGTIVAISSDGLILPPAKYAKPRILGGNYYIGDDNVIYSFRYDGVSFKNEKITSRVKTVGYSYVLFEDNGFALVDGMGKVYNEAVRVSSTKSAFNKVNGIIDTIDPVSVWTPNTARRN